MSAVPWPRPCDGRTVDLEPSGDAYLFSHAPARDRPYGPGAASHHYSGDRIVDDLVFWGNLDTITAKLGRHVHVGADHVAVQVIGLEQGTSAMPQWRKLAQALLPE